MTRLNRRIYGAALPAPEVRTNGSRLIAWLARVLGARPRRQRTLNG
ncbi:hypothetical protein [Pelagibacterium halotolerans]